MDKFLVTFVIISLIGVTLSSQTDSEQYNQDQAHLDPLNDPEAANSAAKEQEKRTILKPTIPKYAWAKHVTITPSGSKRVIGFGPVDLKYTPVIRPISVKLNGYHYDKPKIQFHLRKPVALVHAGWNPITKPVVSIAKPVIHEHQPEVIFKPSKPIHDHIHIGSHIDHKPTVAHLQPAPVTDHIHHHGLPHVDHIHAVNHVDHVHVPSPVLPQPVASPAFVQQPIISYPPLQHPIAYPQPVVAAPNLFEVTKPNLGVLPLGTVFQSPVLKEIPSPVLAPQPVVPAHSFVPGNHLTHLHPVPSSQITHLHPVSSAHLPHLHQVSSGHLPHLHQIAQVPTTHLNPAPHTHPVPHFHEVPHVHPEPHHHHLQVPQGYHLHQLPSPTSQAAPGNFVEYHGSSNFIQQFQNQAPNIQQNPAHFLPQTPEHPYHYHLNFPPLPPNPSEPPNQFSVTQNTNQNIFPTHQHPPTDDLNFFRNQGPNVFHSNQPQGQEHFQPQADVNQNDLKYQPADQVSTQHFFHSQQPQVHGVQEQEQQQEGYDYPQPGQYIQPGQTDLQFPLHLPQHPGFQGIGRQFQQNEPDHRFTETIFKPSIQLEPPYNE